MRAQHLSKKGFTLVEIMIVIAIVALLAAIAIPNLLRARLHANDTMARSTLRTIATACETYATDEEGVYPTDIAMIRGTLPPYLDEDYCTGNPVLSGYTYDCTFHSAGYTIIASPLGSAGSHPWTVTTGSVLKPN